MQINHKYLLIDSSTLIYRGFYAHQTLRSNGKKTGAIYGFLSMLSAYLTQCFQNGVCVVFFFDSRNSLRKAIYPPYKEKRAEQRKQNPEEYADIVRQADAIRRFVLPSMGFRNIFIQDGYEADDLIAHFIEQIYILGLQQHKNIFDIDILTSDKDMYQLLKERVIIVKPGNPPIFYYRKNFEDEYGISPNKWPCVKAIAGCYSDNVEGITGVGEKGAISYLLGKLGGRKKEAIDSSLPIIKRNLKLVTIPYPGVQDMETQPFSFNREAFVKMCVELNFMSLLRHSNNNGIFTYGNII